MPGSLASLSQMPLDYGKFYGTDVVALPQRHKVGSTQFVFDDKTINVIEYAVFERYGIGLVTAGNTGMGRYLLP